MTLPDEFMDGSIPAIFMLENYIMAATRSPGLDGNCSWGGVFGGWVLWGSQQGLDPAQGCIHVSDAGEESGRPSLILAASDQQGIRGQYLPGHGHRLMP